jgi:hypothetical protein
MRNCFKFHGDSWWTIGRQVCEIGVEVNHSRNKQVIHRIKCRNNSILI